MRATIRINDKQLMGQRKKKKVVWLYTHFLFWTGGTRFVVEVTKRLQQSLDVKIIVEKASLDIKRECERNGTEIKEIGSLTSTSPIYWLFFPFMLWLYEKRIRKETDDADVVISGMFPMNSIATRLNKPTIQNCWEPFAFFYDNHFINGFPLPKRIFIRMLIVLYKHLDMNGIKNSDVITTLNRTTEDLIGKIYERDAIKTYMGVDTDFFRPVTIIPSNGNKEKIIMHSTDYTMMKGTRFIIEALPLVKDKISEVKLIITHTANDPKERANLLNKARTLRVDKNIEFVGTVPYSKLPEYYSRADLVAFTGHPECLGPTASLTVLEAMACETPVVRSIASSEEVEDGVSGFLVDPRDKFRLAAVIVKLLSNKDLARKMGQEGRKRVLTMYNWENTSNIFSEVISGLLEKKR